MRRWVLFILPCIWTLTLLWISLSLFSCAGTQSRVIGEAGRQGQVIVFTPEQTQIIRDMASGQMPAECPTAVGSFVKNTQGKVTLFLRCE
jgi:hypothetical protein